LEARETELLQALEEAGVEQTVPAADTLKEAQTLVDLLADTPPGELEDVRLRLRSALRRVVDKVYVLVASDGKDRYCAVEVYFRATGRRRNYFVKVRPRAGNQNVRRPGRWWCSSNRISFVNADGTTRPGLRDPKNVPMYLRNLLEWDPETEPHVTTGEVR
jgi:hypothetical protein